MGGDAFIKIGLTGWRPTDKDVPLVHDHVSIRDNVFKNVTTREL